MLCAYALTNALEARRVARDGLFASVFGMNWRAARQGTQYLQDPDPSPLVHYWSLGVEEQFYLVWPLLLLVLCLVSRWARLATVRRTLALGCVALGTASFTLALAQTKPANSYAYFGTFERVWQLALGGLLAALAARVSALPQPVLVMARWTGAALIGWFFVAADLNIVYPGRKSLIPAAGAALIIAAGLPGRHRRDPLTRLLCSRPAQLGGRYSYSWYLWHYPPLVLLPIYLDRPLHAVELIECAAGSLIAAVLTYHVVEHPLRSTARLGMRRCGRALALGAILLVLSVSVSQLAADASSREAAHSRVTDHFGHELVPQPAVAAAERPQPYSNGCFESYSDDLARDCRYLPDTGHGDVVVVGDSHAAVWFSATLQIAREHQWGFRIWGRNSCPFADITKRITGPYLKCDAWRRDVVHRLVETHPSLVIIASLDSGLPPFYARTASGKVTSRLVVGSTAKRLYQQGYAANLAILRKAGIHVLVIHDNPGYPKSLNAPDCVLAHPGHLDECSLPQAQASPTGPGDLGAAHEVGAVSTVDFTRSFCHGGRCYQVIGSTLAYRDYNHLTQAMTRRLAPVLEGAAVATERGEVVAART